MDCGRLSYSTATTVTVVTETFRLFFLLAMEESLERVLTLCRFVAMLLASQSLEHIGRAHLLIAPSSHLLEGRPLCQLARQTVRPLVSLAWNLTDD